jgi:hypothetical protein
VKCDAESEHLKPGRLCNLNILQDLVCVTVLVVMVVSEFVLLCQI